MESAIKRIRQNAERLRSDVQLLFGVGRHASRALLQFFCLKELGKLHLILIGAAKEARFKNFHRRKQEAALCLVVGGAGAKWLYERLPQLGIGLVRNPEWINMTDDELLKSAGNGVLLHWLETEGIGEYGRILDEPRKLVIGARAGVFEHMRRVAAYVDEHDEYPVFHRSQQSNRSKLLRVGMDRASVHLP